MSSRTTPFAGVAAAILTLAACGAANVQGAPQDPEDRARQALAASGVGGELRLLSSQPTQWPDSSLGCPKQGQLYMQVVTPGHVLRFADPAGRSHEVHVSDTAAVVCSTGIDVSRAKRPRTARPLPELSVVSELARQDLAERLGVAVADVRVQHSDSVTWPDESLGCSRSQGRQPQARDPQGAGVPGFQLLLVARGQQYTYHTDAHRAIACPPIESL